MRILRGRTAVLTIIALLFLAYAVGSIPSGYLLVRAKLGRDVRMYGSHGVGAINVWRVGGGELGAFTLLADMGKGTGVVILAAQAKAPPWAIAAVGFLVTLGQVYSLWFLLRERRFSGGKGVACCLGVLVGLVWIGALPALAVLAPVCLWVLGLVAPRIVGGRRPCISPATMAATLAMPVAVYLAHASASYVLSSAAIALLILARHKDNIRRLRAGSEPRLGRPLAINPVLPSRAPITNGRWGLTAIAVNTGRSITVDRGR